MHLVIKSWFRSGGGTTERIYNNVSFLFSAIDCWMLMGGQINIIALEKAPLFDLAQNLA
jgi:hypothetical protein